MTDSQYIRKAVELADGFSWEWTQDITGTRVRMPVSHDLHWLDNVPMTQVGLDALAAQLVRQVDALDDYAIHQEPNKTILCGVTLTDKGFESHHCIDLTEGPDRTMNTIKAIIDSEVLKNEIS